jgi:hypothetical protein
MVCACTRSISPPYDPLESRCQTRRQTTEPDQDDARESSWPTGLGGIIRGALMPHTSFQRRGKRFLSRAPLAFLTVSDSLLGSWHVAPSGLLEASPRWRGPVLPGEPQTRPVASRKRPTLPGETLPPLPYRQTASGYRVAWDEPGESF